MTRLISFYPINFGRRTLHNALAHEMFFQQFSWLKSLLIVKVRGAMYVVLAVILLLCVPQYGLHSLQTA